MKNFIQTRIQSFQPSKIFTRIKHNMRKIKSLNAISDAYNIMINPKTGELIELNDKSVIDDYYNTYAKGYKIDRQIHDNNHLQSKGRVARTFHSSWAEGVITFSEQLLFDLKNKKFTEEDLCKTAFETVNDICQQMGTTPVQIVYHRDESIPHFHYFFRNFDDNGSSICFNNRTRDKLSILQDIVHSGFSKFGFDRGIKKDKEDLGVFDYTTTKKWKASQLDNLQKNISQLKFDLLINEPKLKNVYDELNKSKNAYKDLRDQHSRDSQEYKELNLKYQELQKEEQKVRLEHKNLKATIQELKDEKNITENEILNKQNLLKTLEENIEIVKEKLINPKDIEKNFETIADEIFDKSKIDGKLSSQEIRKNIKRKLKENSKIIYKEDTAQIELELRDQEYQNKKLQMEKQQIEFEKEKFEREFIQLKKLNKSHTDKIFDKTNKLSELELKNKEMEEMLSIIQGMGINLEDVKNKIHNKEPENDTTISSSISDEEFDEIISTSNKQYERMYGDISDSTNKHKNNK